MTSLHPPSFHRNDFSICIYPGQGVGEIVWHSLNNTLWGGGGGGGGGWNDNSILLLTQSKVVVSLSSIDTTWGNFFEYTQNTQIVATSWFICLYHLIQSCI